MSKSFQPVVVNILDKEYRIVCAVEEQEALIDSAQQLDKQMRLIRDTGKVVGADRIAVLAALNLSSDPRHDEGVLPSDLTDRLVNLRRKIENVLDIP